VAQFVGSHPINIMDAHWEGTQPEISLFTPEGPRARISEALCERLQAKGVGPTFVLGIRPDFLRLTTPHDNEELRGEVFTRQVLGNQILYLIRLGEHELRAVASAQYRLELGENVALELDSDRVFVFDRETEECLIN
jgi:multiple sugar transport system ATP-binding protein